MSTNENNIPGDVLERDQAVILSNRDGDVFLQLLKTDEEPNEALRGAAEAHRRLIDY